MLYYSKMKSDCETSSFFIEFLFHLNILHKAHNLLTILIINNQSTTIPRALVTAPKASIS